MTWADQSIALGQEGYSFILNRRLSASSDALPARLFGRRVMCLGGPRAARLFFDRDLIHRDQMPGLSRKALVLKALGGNSITCLTDLAGAHWAIATSVWAQDGRVVLFDAAAKVLTRAGCTWAGAPLPAAGADALAANLVAVADSSSRAVPLRWRAALSRRRTALWGRRIIVDAREGRLPAAEGSVVEAVAGHRDLDGKLLSVGAAASELLNLIRPVVAAAWSVTFVAHALHQHPWLRERVALAEEPMVRAFTDEVRRFYPHTAFLEGRVRHHFRWSGQHFPRGSRVLFDIYGTHHDPDVWDRPEVFDPDRFLLDRPPDRFAFLPQGGPLTANLVQQAAVFLARLNYDVPEQDLTIPLGRIPTRPRSGFVITDPKPWHWDARSVRAESLTALA